MTIEQRKAERDRLDRLWLSQAITDEQWSTELRRLYQATIAA